MGAEIEPEYLRHAWSVRVRLYAKDVTASDQAGGVSITMYVPVRAHRKARQGGNGLRKGSLFVANERHAVAVNRLVRARRCANLDKACGRQVEVGCRASAHGDECEVRRDQRRNIGCNARFERRR